VADPAAELSALVDVAGLRYSAMAVSATTGFALGTIGPWLFDRLRLARVYTKVPGRPADMSRPFTLRVGQTVEDVARLVHKDVARSLKYARVWGGSGFESQHVGRDHPIADGDVIELHV
jgi:ribosome-interacting GTPase 1